MTWTVICPLFYWVSGERGTFLCKQRVKVHKGIIEADDQLVMKPAKKITFKLKNVHCIFHKNDYNTIRNQKLNSKNTKRGEGKWKKAGEIQPFGT